jgi:hypothetical protein
VGILAEQVVIPHVLLSGMVKKAGDVSHSLELVMNDEHYLRQLMQLSSILRHVSRKDKRTLIAFFLLDDRFYKYERVALEKKLEDWMEAKIKGKWQVEVHFLPVSYGNIDLDKCRVEVERLIHKLCVRFPFEQFGQIVGFGDPSLFSLIFLEGVRQFADRYVSIYWTEKEVHMEPTATDPPLETWSKQFRDFIIEHDYQAALEMLQDLEETKEKETMAHLLQMMVDRLNFAIEDTLFHLEKALELLGAEGILVETKEKLLPLLSPDLKTRDLARIVELYRHLDMYVDMGDTVAFLIRFYRAREAILYYLLQHAQTVPGKVTVEKKSTIYEVIELLEEKYDQWEVDGYYGAYFYLKSLNVAGALQVRNRSFIGHARRGVDQKELWHAYYGTANTTLEKAKRRFIMDTSLLFRDLGVELDENITDLNRFLLQLTSQYFGGKESRK